MSLPSIWSDRTPFWTHQAAITGTSGQLPDLTGTTAVVTGANSGIGLETARALVRHGAAVTMACRNLPAAEQAAKRIRSSHKSIDSRGVESRGVDARGVDARGVDARGVDARGVDARGVDARGVESRGVDVRGVGVGDPDVRVAQLDLSSLASVRSFADAWEGPLDLLVNNAGVMTPRTWQGTTDGFELQLGTNHLGHFALTGLLLSALHAGTSPRVVTVASLAHHRGRADLLDGNPPQTYRPEAAYGNSKLANVLFAAELQRRAAVHGSALTSTMAHPGISATGLVVDRQGMGASRVVRVAAPWLMRAIFQSAAAGAKPILHAAALAAPGSYTGPRWLGESRGPVGPARLSALARDDALASRLWQVSQDLTGVEYGW